jgi:hypothetical protein
MTDPAPKVDRQTEQAKDEGRPEPAARCHRRAAAVKRSGEGVSVG